MAAGARRLVGWEFWGRKPSRSLHADRTQRRLVQSHVTAGGTRTKGEVGGRGRRRPQTGSLGSSPWRERDPGPGPRLTEVTSADEQVDGSTAGRRVPGLLPEPRRHDRRLQLGSQGGAGTQGSRQDSEPGPRVILSADSTRQLAFDRPQPDQPSAPLTCLLEFFHHGHRWGAPAPTLNQKPWVSPVNPLFSPPRPTPTSASPGRLTHPAPRGEPSLLFLLLFFCYRLIFIFMELCCDEMLQGPRK